MKRCLFLMLSILMLSNVYPADFEDKALAVVGDEPILTSEVLMALVERGLPENVDTNSAEYKNLFNETYNNIVMDKLILVGAQKESINVSDDEINKYYQAQWSQIENRFPSKTALEDEIKKSGYTVDSFQRKIKKMVKDGLLKQKFLDTKFPLPIVTDSDVKKFYLAKKDSLPDKPAMVKLFVVDVVPSDSLNPNKYLIDSLAQVLMSGTPFDSVKSKIKADDKKIKTIDLKELIPGSFKPEVEQAIFSLNENEMNKPLLDSEGNYFIFFVRKIDGKKRDVSGILVPYPKEKEGSKKIKEAADSVYSWLQSGKQLPQYYNGTQVSANTTDYLPITNFAQEAQDYLLKTKNGDILPIETKGNGYSIFRLIDKISNRPLNLDDDFDTIKKISQNEKRKQNVLAYLDKLKKSVYIELKK